MQPYLAQIMMFGGNFAIRGWSKCEGQLLPIASYTALFSILGTTYGGDGRTTFGLPDMRGRAPVSAGRGPGLSNYPQGPGSGSENRTLSILNLPSHSHNINVANANGTTPRATGNHFSKNVTDDEGDGTKGDLVYNEPSVAFSGTMATDTLSNTGGNQSFDIRQPYTVVNFLIALEGLYPSRN